MPLYALVQSEHKRFQMLSKCSSANSRIMQVVRQRIPHRRSNRRESPSKTHWATVWHWPSLET